MAFTDNQKLYAMYLLGLWESSCAWDSTSYDAYINYGDAKSIGILHWTYGSAVRLCATMEAHAPNQWAALPQSWRDVASAGGDFETVDFGSASIDRWCASVRDNYDEAVAHQTWYWMDTTEPESFEDHRSTLEGDLGPMPTQNATVIKNLIFYMRLRHNMGYYVADVFNGAGGWEAPLEAVRDQALYEYSLFRDYDIYGQGWANATNDIYRQLAEWDGESAPPEFGAVLGYDRSPSSGSGGGVAGDSGGTEGGGKPSTPDLTSSNNLYIQRYGDDMVLFMRDGSRELFHKTTGSVWVPTSRASNVEAGGNTPVAPTEPAPQPPVGEGIPGAAEMLEWCEAHQGAWYYQQGTYNTLDTGGPCDCSGFVSRMLWAFAPSVWNAIGGGDFQFSTQQLWNACTDIAVRPTAMPDLRDGDVFFENNQPNADGVVSWSNGGRGHVLMYLGGKWWDVTTDWDGRPSSGGPYVMNDADTLVTNPNWWTVGNPFWCVSRFPY